MRLDPLAADLTEAGSPLPDLDIAAVTSDSRKAAPGSLFVALSGAKADGARFAADAVARGAVAILAGPEAGLGTVSVPVIRSPDPRRALALIAARLAGPQPETIVAVTGTSGKTSVAAFVRQIWAAAGLPAASIGTVGVVSPRGAVYGSLTTPDPVDLARTLADLAADGVSHAALEASSHGLDQRRLDGVRLAAGAFTNLSRDHLDYHPTVEAYFAAKMRLFDDLLGAGQGAVVDVDTPAGEEAAAHARRRGLDLLTVGRGGTALRFLGSEPDGFRQIMTVEASGRHHRIRLPLLGTFQVSNALVAAGLTLVTGLAIEPALGALEGLVGASGRLDLVGTTAAGAPVFVDYAHKPDALEKVLEALRPYTRGRLVVVVGCGGDRDPGKRPIMGEIATRLADVAIVTDDNPRSEDPALIRRAILAAAPGALEIGDRAEAIATGVAMLGADDILVVAGKGHETGQIVGDRVLPFSDHDAARAALAQVAS